MHTNAWLHRLLSDNQQRSFLMFSLWIQVDANASWMCGITAKWWRRAVHWNANRNAYKAALAL